MPSNDLDDLDEFPHFSAAFPLPFRVLFLAGLGILAWATNLHGLDHMGIDAVRTLELGSPDAYNEKHRQPLPKVHSGYRLVHTDPSVFYIPVYKLFFTYASWCFASWLIFRLLTQGGNLLLVDLFGYIPVVAAMFILVVLVCPFNMVQKRERDMFLLALWRCIFPSGRVYFSDVVFADIFTSYTKVSRDVWLSFLMFLPGNTWLVTPPAYGWSRWIVPTIMSLPYLIRFRQCLVEFSLDQSGSRKQLWNAIKYATSFPVIFLSAAQKLVEGHISDSRIEHPFFRMWLFAAAVNALYSFWWDVTCDWGLELLMPKGSKANSRTPPPRPLVLPELHSRSSSLTNGAARSPSDSIHDVAPVHPYPWGLRRVLLYPLPVYPLLIFLNLILRLTFTIKLSSHLYSNSDGSYVMFWLETAEIIRRWMWVFVRVEWESIRRASDAKSRARIDESASGDEEGYEMVGTSISGREVEV